MRRRTVILPGAVPATAHTAVLMGASLGGPAELTPELVEQLIAVERRGLHILLVAGDDADAGGTIAAIARHVYVVDGGLAERLTPAWGRERVLRGADLTEAGIRRAARTLPTPASRRLSRRIYNRIRGRAS